MAYIKAAMLGPVAFTALQQVQTSTWLRTLHRNAKHFSSTWISKQNNEIWHFSES